MATQVRTRPVQPDDYDRFVRLYHRMSPDTLYRRFHTSVPRIRPELLHRLVTVDHEHREAVVAVVGDEVIGVARYDRSREDPATAEFAVVVEDAWQGRGVGRRLLTEIAELAARRGVHHAAACVQTDNNRMVTLIHELLPEARLRVAAATYDVDGELPEEQLRPAGAPRAPLPSPAAAGPAPGARRGR